MPVEAAHDRHWLYGALPITPHDATDRRKTLLWALPVFVGPKAAICGVEDDKLAEQRNVHVAICRSL